MTEKRSNKLTTTIRLDPLQRDMLEAIAEREMRTLSNQISVLLHSAIKQYLAEQSLAYVPATKQLQSADDFSFCCEAIPPE